MIQLNTDKGPGIDYLEGFFFFFCPPTSSLSVCATDVLWNSLSSIQKIQPQAFLKVK